MELKGTKVCIAWEEGKRGDITTDHMDIKWMIRKYYQKLYVNKSNSLRK